MQTTELDPALSQTLSDANQPGLTLVIGNKNYSSWSMRPWVAMTAFGIPFQEVRVLLDQPDTAARIADFSGAGRVPVLLAGEITVWDSLAICEYVAEQFPDQHLWPRDVAARAVARSVSAEMHSGFQGLRRDMSMNIKASLPGRGRSAEAQGDIGRVCEIWEECLSRFGHHRTRQRARRHVLRPQMLFEELLGKVFADRQAVPDRHVAGQQHRHPPGPRILGDAVGGVGLVEQQAHLLERDAKSGQRHPGPHRPGRIVLVADDEGQAGVAGVGQGLRKGRIEFGGLHRRGGRVSALRGRGSRRSGRAAPGKPAPRPRVR